MDTHMILTNGTDWKLQNPEGETIATGEFETPINIDDENFNFDQVTSSIDSKLTNDGVYTYFNEDTDELSWTVTL